MLAVGVVVRVGVDIAVRVAVAVRVGVWDGVDVMVAVGVFVDVGVGVAPQSGELAWNVAGAVDQQDAVQSNCRGGPPRKG